ncbi:unnamed protein product [Lactuca saligna]|uniref:Uncharacterized protein n=1 Tax=Lactuca saligna TaxID=75948 RepID=A0AA36ELX5_LACSI|nr:unnamed protein product [Lactuca saligna]
MWRDISFDKDTWTDVSGTERVGMFEYLSTWFGFGKTTNDPMASAYWASLNNRICARYRGRKNVTKTRLTGFKGDVEVARAQASAGVGCSKGACERRLSLNLLQQRDVDVNVFLQNTVFVTAIGDIIR